MKRTGTTRRAIPLASALGLLLAGCQGGSLTGIDKELGDPFGLRIGETAVLDDGGITLALLDIPEDSRCPVNVVCVWQGNARLAMRATVGGEAHRFALNTAIGVVGPGEAVVGGYLVELLEVDPRPVAGEPIPRPAYRALLRVTVASATGAAAAAP